MSTEISAIQYLLDLLFKERNKREEFKSEITYKFRQLITEIEIYLHSLPRRDRCSEQEHRIARGWTELSAIFAHYEHEFSDVCLNMSSFWTNPDTVPVDRKNEYIKLVKELFVKGRERKLYSAGPC